MGKKQWINLGMSVVVGGGLIFALSFPLGPAPAMAPTFNPGTGVWKTAADSQLLPKTEELKLAGVEKPVSIVFEQDGTAHIKAATDHDAFAAIGYMHAKNRLFQMDLIRRQASGTLSEVAGGETLEIDKYQRALGIERTANYEWEQLKKANSPMVDKLEAYAEGVNAVMDQMIESNTLPAMFRMMGYEPRRWAPTDSMMLKGILNQMMGLRGNVLYYELFAQKLGYDKMIELMPVLPVNQEYPSVSGPYSQNPIDKMPISAEEVYNGKPKKATASATSTATEPQDVTVAENVAFAAIAGVAKTMENLPDMLQFNPHSNGWVVDGTKTATGKPILAGDPHLDLSSPSIFYQFSVESPAYHFNGVTMPGLPFPLSGQNQDITWTMTGTQSQQTFYYKEKTDPARPNQYYWNGEWREMTKEEHAIPIKGKEPFAYEVYSTVHGPVVTRQGLEMVINWTGSIPNDGIESLDKMVRAQNYDDFSGALKNWAAPIMDFFYADSKGNIGMIAAGHYPVFPKDAKPWIPMPGTGESDIIGRIPWSDIPKTYNPTSHFVHGANQRPVSTDYPYYIGTTWDYDLTYRSTRMYKQLAQDKKFTVDDMKKMQKDSHDMLAETVIPTVIKAVQDSVKTDAEKAALAELTQWDFQMDKDKSAPSIYWKFWDNYMKTVFQPWWDYYKVSVKDHPAMEINAQASLTTVLESLTLNKPDSEWFTNPLTQEKGTADSRMVEAFRKTVEDLVKNMGQDVTAWNWGNIHKRQILSLAQVPALNLPPRGDDGSMFTLNVSRRSLGEIEKGYDYKWHYGPAWRLIVDLSTGKGQGIYPGGQSENPVSPLYTDRLEDYYNGNYRELLWYEQADGNKDNVRWNLVPGK